MATSVSGAAATPLRLFSSSSSSSSAAARYLPSSCGCCLRPARAVVPPPAPQRERWRPRLAPVPGARPALLCAAVRTIEHGEFADEVLGSDLPVLVEFVAGWCGPCRLIGPVVEWASKEYEGKLKVVKIDHDANPQLIEEYKVYGLPALILFKKGQEVPGSRREGAITKVKLKEYLDSLLESTTTVG